MATKATNTFIQDSKSNWYLEIATIDQLKAYWINIFNEKFREAYETLEQTKEFGDGHTTCNTLQAMIGYKAKGSGISYHKAYETIGLDIKVSQYKHLLNNEIIYITPELSWVTDVDIEVVHRKASDSIKESELDWFIQQ